MYQCAFYCDFEDIPKIPCTSLNRNNSETRSICQIVQKKCYISTRLVSNGVYNRFYSWSHGDYKLNILCISVHLQEGVNLYFTIWECTFWGADHQVAQFFHWMWCLSPKTLSSSFLHCLDGAIHTFSESNRYQIHTVFFTGNTNAFCLKTLWNNEREETNSLNDTPTVSEPKGLKVTGVRVH